MSQYIKIPRGRIPNRVNDEIFRRIVCMIGKIEKSNFVTAKLSDYARGKIYLRNKHGICGCTLKRMHTIKVTTQGFENFGDNYSNYVSLHEGKAKIIFMVIQDYIKKDPNRIAEFRRICEEFYTTNPNITPTYATSLLHETFNWIFDCKLETEPFCQFNKRDNAWNIANDIKCSIEEIDENF